MTSRRPHREQLDRYVIWRDTHTAMILFRRNNNATEVINQAVEAIHSHPGLCLNGNT